MPARATAAEAIATSLRDAGTTTLFGMPGGGSNLEVIDACQAAGLRFVLAHTETAAAIMATASAELTGAPGACVVTRGPGVASVVNGVANARLDRLPLVVISDSVPMGQRTRITHQLLDQTALLATVSKASVRIPSFAGQLIDDYVRLSMTWPQGPVHLDIDPDAPSPATVPTHAHSLDPAAVKKAAALLAGARQPVLLIGLGARTAITSVRSFVDRFRWPVLMTYKAAGIVPSSADNAAGLLTGATLEAPILQAADLILGIGLDPVELIPAAWNYPADVLSLVEAPTGSSYLVDGIELIGPLTELLDLASRYLVAPSTASGARAARLAAEATLKVAASGLTPHEVVQEARRQSQPDTIATVDAGAHMLVTMPLWHVEEPGRLLISSGLATMGYALPAAVGVAVARPEARVVCFTGDGGIGMALGELETLSRLGLKVTVVVLNDSALSLIEIKQRPGASGGADAVRFRRSDYADIARASGVDGWKVSHAEAFARAFSEATALDGPALIDAVVDPSGYRGVLQAARG